MSDESVTLDAIRECLDGRVPSTMATCAPDGTPNVTYTSQVDYVDGQHVALSFQFFNKTRDNILLNPRATVDVVHPDSAATYRLFLHYLRTESAGVRFESMRAKLAGIASHTGMAGVFKLRGADIYRVLQIEAVPGLALPQITPRRNLLAALRAACEQLAACSDLERLFEESLAALQAHLGLPHLMLLLVDESGQHLYTVASRGYAQSGVGSEISLGDGVIGVAAEYRAPIRIAYLTEEYRYQCALRATALEAGLARLQAQIPFPGLSQPHSQLAVPVLAGERLLGVLYAESPDEQRFGYDDEDALVLYAQQLGLRILQLGQELEAETDAAAADSTSPPSGSPLLVRHYADDHSVFLDDDYLIKGVAGAILRKLLREYQHDGRTQFSNRELRLDASLGLPDIADNLEARLVLLARRLAERSPDLRIDKTGRGRFALHVGRPISLQDMPGHRRGPPLVKI